MEPTPSKGRFFYVNYDIVEEFGTKFATNYINFNKYNYEH